MSIMVACASCEQKLIADDHKVQRSPQGLSDNTRERVLSVLGSADHASVKLLRLLVEIHHPVGPPERVGLLSGWLSPRTGPPGRGARP